MKKIQKMTQEEETALYQKLMDEPQLVLNHLNANNKIENPKFVRQTGPLMDLFIDTLFETYFSPQKYKKVKGFCKTCLAFILTDATDGAHDFLSHEDEVELSLRVPKPQARAMAFKQLIFEAADKPTHKREVDGVVYMRPPGINRIHVAPRAKKPCIHTQLQSLFNKNGEASIRALKRGRKMLDKILGALVSPYYPRQRSQKRRRRRQGRELWRLKAVFHSPTRQKGGKTNRTSKTLLIT